jgi:N,N'-diacetylchitobiose transport system permease protein
MTTPTMPELATGETERSLPPPSPSAQQYRRRPYSRWRRFRRRQLLPLLLLLPAVVLLGVLTFYPLGKLVITSFQQLGLPQVISPKLHPPAWSGLANYRTMFGSSQLGSSLAQTVFFVIACVGLTMLVGTGLALLMRRLGKVLRLVLSVSLLFAWSMPTSAASIIWTWLFQSEWGVVNYLLTLIGFHFSNHEWFGSEISAYSIIVAVIVWGAVPFVALTMYSALTIVPRELFEAAAVDGASPATVFRQVTMPIVRPIFVLLSVMSVIWDTNVFNQIWYLTQGNAQLLNVMPLGVWQYIEAFSSESYGLGAAIAILMIVLLLAVTGYYLRIMVRTGEVKAEVKA